MFLAGNKTKNIRMAANPLDKSTIVSILPSLIDEKKPTLQPGRFIIQPGTYEKPSLLVVGPSSWWKQLEENQPMLEIPNSSVQIADSVIRDFANGLIACNMGDCMPGLFYIPGELTIEEIKKNPKHKLLLEAANVKQRNWFSALVKLADILWARSNGNPLSIGDDMRMAAQELQLKDKAWLRDYNTLELKNCPACGTLRNSSFPVCQHCKAVIDAVKFKELGLSFAN